MKKLLTLLFIIYAGSASSQSVSITTDGTTAHQSAMLDVKSTNKGVLVPRMSTAQRIAIASPATGLLVFDNDTKSFWFYNGIAWTNLAGGGGELSFPYKASVSTNDSSFHINNSQNFPSIVGTNPGFTAVLGQSNSGVGLEGASTSGTGIYGNSISGTGISAISSSGFGLVANSGTSTAIYAFSNNANPTISANNTNFQGLALKGTSTNFDAVLGTTGGTSKAGIKGEATGAGGYGVYGTSSSNQGYGVRGDNATGVGVYGYSSGTGTGVRAQSLNGTALDVQGNLRISGGNTSPSNGAVLTSDAAGNAVWKNNRVAFRVDDVNANHISISNGVDTRVHFKNEDYDLSNNYFLHVGTNPTSLSSTFTVPKTGIYHFDVSLQFTSDDADFYEAKLLIKRKRGNSTSVIAIGDGSKSYATSFFDAFTARYSGDLQLQAGDVIWIDGHQDNVDGEVCSMIGGHFNVHLVFEN